MSNPHSRKARLKAVKEFRKGFANGVSATALNNALTEIVGYNCESEEDDFLDADHTADIEEHIFGALIVIQEYLRYQR